MFFFPWKLFHRNSDDPLIAWQERRCSILLCVYFHGWAVSIMKMTNPNTCDGKPSLYRRRDVAISTVSRRYIDGKTSQRSTEGRRYSDAFCRFKKNIYMGIFGCQRIHYEGSIKVQISSESKFHQAFPFISLNARG